MSTPAPNANRLDRAIQAFSTAIAEHMKSLPDPPAEAADYRVWTEKFIPLANRLLNLPGYAISPEINGYLTQASQTVEPFADASWLPWAANLLPNISARVTREEARRQREDEDLALFTAGKISSEEYLTRSDDDDEMVVDGPSTRAAAPAAAELSKEVEIVDTTPTSTAVDVQTRSSARSGGKGKDKIPVKGKGKERAANKPSREPSSIPSNASQMDPGCARCTKGFNTTFTCYLVDGASKCVKCTVDKQKCSLAVHVRAASSSIIAKRRKVVADGTSATSSSRVSVVQSAGSEARLKNRKVPSQLLDPATSSQSQIELVEELSMDVVRGWTGPSSEEGLIRVHEVLSWRLDGYAAELRSVLEGYQFAKHRLDSHIEVMRAKGIAIPGESDAGADDEEEFEFEDVND